MAGQFSYGAFSDKSVSEDERECSTCKHYSKSIGDMPCAECIGCDEWEAPPEIMEGGLQQPPTQQVQNLQSQTSAIASHVGCNSQPTIL